MHFGKPSSNLLNSQAFRWLFQIALRSPIVMPTGLTFFSRAGAVSHCEAAARGPSPPFYLVFQFQRIGQRCAGGGWGAEEDKRVGHPRLATAIVAQEK